MDKKKILIASVLTIVVVGGIYFGYKYYKTQQTSSPNKEKNDRKIKIVLV